MMDEDEEIRDGFIPDELEEFVSEEEEENY
jgi:hypothetical protein